LRLPFDGTWTVGWGGRTVKDNYHAATVDQRFAYDILIMRDGSTRKGAGTRNEDYHCFGEKILAPADGTVVAAVDGLPDNVPGSMDKEHPAGNHVILDHGNGEFSFLAHFKQGSLNVKPGERISTGQLLGLCGNSGHSREPHLHYHLQDNGVLFGGKGLPAQFRGYIADGQPVAKGECVKGQKISPASAPK